MTVQINSLYFTGIIVNSGITANSLGVLRSFGRRGIPVILIDSERCSMTRYSRYISHYLKCKTIMKSEIEYINVLLDFGRHINRKLMIIPTGDSEVLALSKYKKELEQFYLLPVPSHEIVKKLVNKRSFYEMLVKMDIPHPKTYFPEDTAELLLMGKELGYPYIIKPVYSSPFQNKFHRKCFMIKSSRELVRAVDKLQNNNFELMIQEIIPGKVIYAFYSYFNNKSEPLAICGWDKIRHYPPDFGSGSFCKSVWRPTVVEQTVSLLKAIGYYGFAAPELIRDPRDGKYKLLEINARTILQNRLGAACGLDIEYIAYLDANGIIVVDLFKPRDNVLWVDDIKDFLSCLILLKRREITYGNINKLDAKKVHSVLAWDDPKPFIALAIILIFNSFKKLLSMIKQALIGVL